MRGRAAGLRWRDAAVGALKESVGVARQWCGRTGKVDNGQVAVYMGYVSESQSVGDIIHIIRGLVLIWAVMEPEELQGRIESL